MGAHRDRHQGIACRTLGTRPALALQAQHLAILRAGRNLDVQAPVAEIEALPATARRHQKIDLDAVTPVDAAHTPVSRLSAARIEPGRAGTTESAAEDLLEQPVTAPERALGTGVLRSRRPPKPKPPNPTAACPPRRSARDRTAPAWPDRAAAHRLG